MAVVAAGRFLAELGLLAGLAVVGWRAGNDWSGPVLGSVLAVSLPIVAAAVWGLWVAPRARRRIADPPRFVVELVLFAAAVAGLVAVGAVGWAAALGILWLATAFAGRKGY
jgi:hypothetical protein